MIEAIFGKYFLVRKRRPVLEDWTGPWEEVRDAMFPPCGYAVRWACSVL